MTHPKKVNFNGIDAAESVGGACTWAWVYTAVPVASACRAMCLALFGFNLAACVATGTSDRASRHTKETAQLLSEAAMAETIAFNCSHKFDVGQNSREAVLAEARGIRDASPDSALIMSEADFIRYSDVFYDSYVSRRGIQDSKPATWCAAGKAEVAAKSRIGKLLIPL
jgi:hypothetical protein